MIEREPDLDQLLNHWMDLGPTVAPDRVAAATRHEIRHTRQLLPLVADLAERFAIMSSNPVRVGAIAGAIVVSILGFTVIGGGEVGDTDQSPTPTHSSATAAPSAAPSDGGVPAGMLDVQYLAPFPLRFFPVGDASCTSIPVDGACFHWETSFGLVEGPAVFANGAVSLTAERCASCDAEWEIVRGTTTILEIRSGGESLYVASCDGEGYCLDEDQMDLGPIPRVGLGLPFPPEETDSEAQRYGWPSYDNVVTFSVPAGWGANGPYIRRWDGPTGRDEVVEFRFAHICRLEAGEPSSVPPSCEGETYAPQNADEVAVVVAGYEGWHRELPSGEVQEWILDIDGWWVSIQLTTLDADPAVVEEAMELLGSIQAAPRD